MTEHPTSHEGRQPRAARPNPADPRGALLRSPDSAEGPEGPGHGDGAEASGTRPAEHSGTAAPRTAAALPSQNRTGGDDGEHRKSGPADTPEPDAHRPRPGPLPVPPARMGGTGGESGHPGPSAHPAPSAHPGASAAVPSDGRADGLPPAPPVPPAPPSGDGDAARHGGDRLRFVGAATRRIARGIDLDEIVMGLCRATVPTFSDAILVYLRDPLPVGDERPVGPVVLRLRRTDRIPDEMDDTVSEGGSLLAPLPVPPDATPSLQLRWSRGEPNAAELCEVRTGGALAEVLRGVRPVFGDTPAARAALPELLGEDHTLPEGRRAILAPLRGRRRVIGAAVFLRRPERAAFEQDDLLVAAQLATHTALGIDKAVLYGREAYIADELQRTMLPETLPQPTGVRLASRYLPAAETARVGGDWYDAIPLPGSRVALVVGDVMGHSMTSAAIMGQLRTTAQTLAGLDLPPQEVLHHLDEQAQRLGSDRMATCLYAVYDPVAHRITIANAGHPPPVLLHIGGRAEVLRVPAGAPIGVGGVDFEAVELDAPAGATLLLYTDGLVESRLRDVWTGIEQLRERLAATAELTGPDHAPPLEALCDEVLDMLGPGDRDDDIALLAARFDGIAPSDVAYWQLDPEDSAPGRARRLARRALAAWDLEDLTESVELLVSEVVTNAVRYASRPITLRLLRTDVLRCEVGDDVPQLPRLRQARATDEGGRGLYLVNRLARRWGATRLSTGKVVWFELNRG
ncbi:SpoIIE family protein phosphatase [Streptomyces sp. LHD-70]|uniref:SpoIIE family protein phosphatase n=1 Tax=Streptomyces sp. LHD-70 TaxID=3072140 RepID=UPI00280DC221|nr:SpoIIE family protein phosphatase [Streptomyces sp. LHD-70]MDQ8702401.1 SpoIIE family protein phosphatase [Streptomyces sp. LHD-70]